MNNQQIGLGSMVNNSQASGNGGQDENYQLVHLNKNELHGLDNLQGGMHYDVKTGLPQIDLDHAFRNHDVMHHVKDHLAQAHASGGLASEALYGRYGDNTMALMSPYTCHSLDHLMGGASRNPHTGHREYFGLSSIFGGIKRGLGKVGHVFTHTIPKAIKGGAGAVFKAAPSVLSGIASGMSGGQGQGQGQGGGLMNTAAGLVGGLLGGGGQQQQQQGQYPQQGQDDGQGGQYGQYPAPQPKPAWMQGAMDAYNQGSSGGGWRQALSNYGGRMVDHYGQNLPTYMQQGLKTAANIGQGQDAREAVGQYGQGMMNHYGQNLPSYMQQGAQTGLDIYHGADPRASMSQYGQSMLNQYGHQMPSYMQHGAQGAMDIANGADPRQVGVGLGHQLLAGMNPGYQSSGYGYNPNAYNEG